MKATYKFIIQICYNFDELNNWSRKGKQGVWLVFVGIEMDEIVYIIGTFGIGRK